MDLSQIHLWEQSALRPEDCSPSVWLRGPTHRHPKQTPRQDLGKARADILRTRAATFRGLLFSMCLCIPVGGAYGLSTVFAENGIGPDQCRSLAGALAPKDQRRIRDYRASTGLSAAQERALNVRVCDPTLLGMIPQLANLVTNGEDFEEMSRRLEGVGEEMSTMTILRALMSTENGLK